MSDVKERLQALIDDEYFTQEELAELGLNLKSNDKAEEAKEPTQETKTADKFDEEEEPKQEEQVEETKPQATEPQATTEKVEEPIVTEEAAPVEPTEPVVDYKAKYEEEVKAREGLLARIDAVEAKLKGMVNAEPDIPLGVSTTPQPEAGAKTEDFQEKFMREHSTNILNR